MTRINAGVRRLWWMIVDHLLLIVIVAMVASLFAILFIQATDQPDQQQYEL